jgi:uncharacterized BrkB/YihY/UPF0761 family membrane protein
MRIATLWDVILRAVQNWWKDNCLRVAASLAYIYCIPTVCLEVISLVASSCGDNRGQIEHRVAQ